MKTSRAKDLAALKAKVKTVTVKSIQEASWASQRFFWIELFIWQTRGWRDKVALILTRASKQSRVHKEAWRILYKLASLLAEYAHLEKARRDPTLSAQRTIVRRLKTIFR